MHLESLTVRNFRCYGDDPIKLILKAGTNAFVGNNGAGKTAALEALKRLFSPATADRQLRRSDVHFGPSEDAVHLDKREIVIDVVFGFETTDEVSAVFNDLFFSATDQSMKVRLILEGLYERSESIEDNIDVKIYSVNTMDAVPFGADDERKTPLRGRTTQYAEVVYIPAHRDSRGVSQFALKNVLQRLEWSADWTDATKAKSLKFAEDLEANLNGTDAITEVTARLHGFWSTLHDGHYDASPKISVIAVEFEKLIRELTLKFDKSPGGAMRQLGELSEGQMSLLYFALSATLHNLIWEMQKALPKALKGFKPADFAHPPLTIFALEEPENHLSPFYLPRLMKLLDTLNATGSAQSIVTSHATSILSRVNPRHVLYFRNYASTLCSTALQLPLPAEKTEEDKFIQQVILANPEIYFAKLVIIGEGDTERIVVPKVAEALGTSLDPSFIAYVSIGGRHAQHLWRLLNGLSIPHITLLDLDFGRHGGGMGRLRNAVTWLTALGPAFIPKLVQTGPGLPQVTVDALAANLPENTALNAKNFDLWIKWLRNNNIFYSSPLDLDMMMLKAFPSTYTPDIAFDAAKVVRTKLRKSVFGDKGKGNTELKRVKHDFSDEELYKYKSLFKSSSKPGSHLIAFGKLDQATLKKDCPEPLRALIEKANALIAPAVAKGSP
ncbi:ATP-dependent endonuclease [Agrobacterium sp. LAD9]|uniref:ATP-dependent nuclease n=1 Tax=Agrobacterium sp. LAD9 TaxID=2055153 RepID=UPI001864C76B|nr:AAA family ATPase [Agrobacterium sp. LAD9]